ncbi:hypothetical protein N7451_011731 [Penicillium sp. IBT 35674x]|nr:hypothetical protein N7451_011731 [Penicillium sp. IBT 35674x]
MRIEITTSEHGPFVGGGFATSEGDGVRAVKEALLEIGADVKRVLNMSSPTLIPHPYFYDIITAEPLSLETFKEKLEEVWNASITEEERPFPQTTRVDIKPHDD